MISWIMALIFLVILLVCVYIYLNRDPVRTITPGKNIVSPADGRIIEIIDLLKVKKGKLGKIKKIASEISNHCYIILIFMNPLNVHVQRAPVEGKVASVKRIKGRFFPAGGTKAMLENKKTEILIKNKDIGKIKVIQSAGFLTRRIKCFVKKNEILLKGQRIGKIEFGSMVILVIPDLHLNVKKGDKVTAGETVIAEYK